MEGTTENSVTPHLLSSIKNPVQISAGGLFCCVVTGRLFSEKLPLKVF
jgi:hypothetical protein